MNELRVLYKKRFGQDPVLMERLVGAGSNRAYYRMSDVDGRSVIGCVGTSREENHAFIYLTGHFRRRQLPVPEILAVSSDKLRYIETDLGGVSLFDALRSGREAGGHYGQEEKDLLVETIRKLPEVQMSGARGLEWSNCYPQPEFNQDSVLFDLNYFKYCFLKATGLDFHELKLEANFRMLAEDLTSDSCKGFLYRDFQARNVMLKGGHPFFIDYQGGRRGPYYYDLASFLWQASAKYPEQLRRELTCEYYEALKNYTEVPSVCLFNERLLLFVLFRQLQVLGAYGFRGYFERKKHFIDSIPPAMENLRSLLNNSTTADAYPYLKKILHSLCELPQFVQDTTPKEPDTLSKYDNKGLLVVRVFSFSYKKGIPEDKSGNGGGYVFDCRSTHNPGRYEPYKQLTGLDEPVIRFLEDDGEITRFLESVYLLADAHVERYLQRGFTSLMFCFGCTGGQHRSVYSAQHLASHLHQKYGIEVHICHREQGIEQVLPPQKR